MCGATCTNRAITAEEMLIQINAATEWRPIPLCVEANLKAMRAILKVTTTSITRSSLFPRGLFKLQEYSDFSVPSKLGRYGSANCMATFPAHLTSR
jgi:hypothetical protein